VRQWLDRHRHEPSTAEEDKQFISLTFIFLMTDFSAIIIPMSGVLNMRRTHEENSLAYFCVKAVVDVSEEDYCCSVNCGRFCFWHRQSVFFVCV